MTAAAASARRWLLAAAAATLAFKLWLSAVFPLTGDEAYFVFWGANPDYGFYDHPPMVGWLLAALLGISRAEWVLRLPVTLLPALLAAGIWLALRRDDEEKAALAALAFLLVPVNVWNIFITTDTPLVFFSFISALCYRQALARRAAAWYAAAGVFLGLAFLSKYFAVLLGIAFVVHALISPKPERDWRGLGITVLCALPFAGVNLAWNYEHCWANLMFNLYNRHGDAGWSWKTPLIFALTLLYAVSPPALWQLARGRDGVAAALADPATRFVSVAFAVPAGIFALLSLLKLIGLHWLLSFVPFFFMAAAALLSAGQLRRSVAYLAAFSALHLAVIAGAAMLPMEAWKNTRYYDGIVYHFRMHDLLRELEPYEREFEFGADGYAPAAVASYYAGRYFFVFGTASSHARHDDILTDFRALDGKNILVLRKNPPQDAEYRPYFRSVEYRGVTIAGAAFHLVLGRGFDYAAYREGVLQPLRARYYDIPWYLPQGRCYFCERYFGAAVCAAKG